MVISKTKLNFGHTQLDTRRHPCLSIYLASSICPCVREGTQGLQETYSDENDKEERKDEEGKKERASQREDYVSRKREGGRLSVVSLEDTPEIEGRRNDRGRPTGWSTERTEENVRRVSRKQEKKEEKEREQREGKGRGH